MCPGLHAERVVVCNIRGRDEIGNKSDRIDADRLSELLRLGSLKTVYHGASALLTLKELVPSYVNLVEDSTRVMLRIKALFRARGIKTPGVSSVAARTRAPPSSFASHVLRCDGRYTDTPGVAIPRARNMALIRTPRE
jgi:hypothetical protein